MVRLLFVVRGELYQIGGAEAGASRRPDLR
jgi:hypothetical protein